MTQVLGVTGQAQHGKDTMAGFARDRDYQRYAFADNVRRALYALNPFVVIEDVDLDEDDPAVLQEMCDEDPGGRAFIRIRELVEMLGGLDTDRTGSGPGWDAAKQLPEVRQLLQRMGTEAVRDVVHEEAWVMALEKQLADEKPARAIITDVRFPNEAEAIKRWGGDMVRVVRLKDDGSRYQKPGLDITHPSEAHVATLPVDFEVQATNVGSLERSVRGVLDAIDEECEFDVLGTEREDDGCGV